MPVTLVEMNPHQIFKVLLTLWLSVGLLKAEELRPDWLTDASLSVQEGYDNNVFLSGVTASPNTTIAPAGSVIASKNLASWVTTVSPHIGINFAPLLGTTNHFPLVSLVYAPDFCIYQNENSESHDTHRLLSAARMDIAPLTLNANNEFIYVDGSSIGPFYPGGLLSAFATAADRDRRRQIQDRADITLRWDCGNWFIRPTASLLYYNFMTELFNVAGYQNYSDRSDVNGGADLGYNILPHAALTLGYRYGYQFQEQFPFMPYSSPNHYQRLLFGLEGKPWSWLDVKIVSGPDFRDYEGDSASHITPLNDLHPVKYYGEASIAATLTSKDSLAFKYKTWQWISSVGRVPYYDSLYGLEYHRVVTEKIGLDLGGSIVSWDYSGGNLPSCLRNDLEYTVSAGLNYSVNSHWNITLACTWNYGQNAENGVANPQDREFSQQLISLGTQWKF